MTSKSSFLDRLKHNISRGSWCLLINSVVLFITLPLIMMINLNRIQTYGYEQKQLMKELYNSAVTLLGFNDWFSFFIMLLAVIMAIQGYVYLHNRQMVDMYHSQPISHKQHFWSIYLSGVIIFAVPYVINLILAIIYAATNRIIDGRMIAITLLAFILNICFFMAVYAVVICAVILTGKRLAAVCASVTLLFYGALLSIVYSLYRDRFFLTYLSQNTYYSFRMARIGIIDAFSEKGFMSWSVLGFLASLGDSRYNMIEKQLSPVALFSNYAQLYAGTIVIAILFTVISYFLYSKRKAERAGVAMAFAGTKNIIECLVSVPVALLIGYIISSAAGDSNLFLIVGVILSSVIMHCIIQVIYEADFKKLFKKLPNMAVGIVVSLVIVVVFWFDLFGYDSYVPKAGEIESASYSITGVEYLDLDAKKSDRTYEETITESAYALQNMYYTDIDNIISLAKESIFVKEKKGLLGHQRAINLLIDRKDGYQTYSDQYLNVSVNYRLKNGKVCNRVLYLDKELASEQLNRLVSSEEYKQSYFQLCDERILEDEEGTKHPITIYDTFSYYNVDPVFASGLREAYIKDIEKYDYDMLLHEKPIARLSVCQYQIMTWPSYECYIYDEFENTLKYLEENDIYKPIEAQELELDKIVVKKYKDDTYEEYESAEYTDVEQMEQIEETLDYHLGYIISNNPEPNLIEIVLYGKEEYYMETKEGVSLPDFVLKDLGE